MMDDQAHDPVAVALANASLLGAGYLMLGRRRLAAGTGLVTVGLLTLLVAFLPSVWWEVLVVGWWAVLVAHGWSLAGGRAGRGGRVAVHRQRLVALCVTVPVLLAVGLVRYDSYRIGQAVADARRHGDCPRAVRALDREWFGHRMADAPLAARDDRTRRACRRLDAARVELAMGRDGGDHLALAAGFHDLVDVLVRLPGHGRMVDTVLDGFAHQLATRDPCHTAAVTDWLSRRQPRHGPGWSARVLTRIAPGALVRCGDDRMSAADWERARARYQQLLDQYPGHPLTTRARAGLEQATRAIELANVRALLQDATSDTTPAYCAQPAKYSGAPPYGPGVNRALLYGNDDYLARLPGDWKASDAADAVLIVCAGEVTYGPAVGTCSYHTQSHPDISGPVTFHQIEIPVKAYELRTGRLVTDTTVRINGASCPDSFQVSSVVEPLGPPPDSYVVASDADVRGAFASLFTP